MALKNLSGSYNFSSLFKNFIVSPKSISLAFLSKKSFIELVLTFLVLGVLGLFSI